MHEEEGLLANFPPTMPEEHVGSLTTGCRVAVFCGVDRESAGVGEGRDLAKDHYV